GRGLPGAGLLRQLGELVVGGPVADLLLERGVLLGDVAGVLDLSLERVAFLRDLAERVAVLIALGGQGLELGGQTADLLFQNRDCRVVVIVRHDSASEEWDGVRNASRETQGARGRRPSGLSAGPCGPGR